MSRIITALIALPVLIASIWFPQLALLFDVLVAAAILLGLYEFYTLAQRQELTPQVFVGIASAVVLLVAIYFNAYVWQLPIFIESVIVVALTIFALSLAMLRGAPFEKMLSSVGATMLGVCYTALLGGHLIAVRGMPFAPKILSFFFLVLMGSDTAAYYTGRAFGRHKLAPNVSPGKTWEGAVGGMMASLVFAALAHFWFFPEIKLSAALPLAALMNVLGVIGDLTESALKRGAGAKDAANILPGHGGLLDRLDSLLFNAPVIYYFSLLYFR